MRAALLLAAALAASCCSPDAPVGEPPTSPEAVDRLRVAYEASGDAAYLRRIIDALPWEEVAKKKHPSTAADIAGMYLVYAAQDDDLVLATCREEAGRRTGLVRTQLLGIVEHAESMRAREAAAEGE